MTKDQAELIEFVRGLNREGISREEVVEALESKAKELDIVNLGLLNYEIFHWLWVEPDSLRDRRIAGELDSYCDRNIR